MKQKAITAKEIFFKIKKGQDRNPALFNPIFYEKLLVKSAIRLVKLQAKK